LRTSHWHCRRRARTRMWVRTRKRAASAWRPERKARVRRRLRKFRRRPPILVARPSGMAPCAHEDHARARSASNTGGGLAGRRCFRQEAADGPGHRETGSRARRRARRAHEGRIVRREARQNARARWPRSTAREAAARSRLGRRRAEHCNTAAVWGESRSRRDVSRVARSRGSERGAGCTRSAT
jgi:hypothetical protein